MIMSNENEVIHYGSETSELECTEHVDVLFLNELKECYGDNFYDQSKFTLLGTPDYASDLFYARTVHELRKRVNSGDIICCMAGTFHRKVAYEIKKDYDVIICEPAAGYNNVFSDHRVFSSNAWMHFSYGEFNYAWKSLPDNKRMISSNWSPTCVPYEIPKWTDDVIFHPIDLGDFKEKKDGGDYLLHISRMSASKGIEMAIRIAEHLDMKIKIAGQEDFKSKLGFDPPNNVELVGVVGPEERAELISGAIAGMALSLYPEPFGLVHAEYMAGGLPTVTTDLGSYKDTVKDGYSGYKIKSFKQGVDAVKNIDKIKSENCIKWVEDNFTKKVLAPQYDDYFKRLVEHVEADKAGKGIYYL